MVWLMVVLGVVGVRNCIETFGMGFPFNASRTFPKTPPGVLGGKLEGRGEGEGRSEGIGEGIVPMGDGLELGSGSGNPLLEPGWLVGIGAVTVGKFCWGEVTAIWYGLSQAESAAKSSPEARRRIRMVEV